MTGAPVRLQPIGFWSYATQDDMASGGRLSKLRSMLMNELQQQYGRNPIKIFQDVAAIPPGSEWDEEIRNALTQATFFIPIITPAFVESEYCAQEVTVCGGDRLSECRDAAGGRVTIGISYPAR